MNLLNSKSFPDCPFDPEPNQQTKLIDATTKVFQNCPKNSGVMHVLNADVCTGKTTGMLMINLWNSLIINNITDGLIVVTAPVTELLDEMYSILKEFFDTHGRILSTMYGINNVSIVRHPNELKTVQWGIEILVTSIQNVTSKKPRINGLSSFDILNTRYIYAMICDEAHNGLGSPAVTIKDYVKDSGQYNEDYAGQWWNTVTELNVDYFLGITATPTWSMYNRPDLYNIYSSGLQRDWTRHSFIEGIEIFNKPQQTLEANFKHVIKRTSEINSLLKNLKNDYIRDPVLGKIYTNKQYSFVKCSIESNNSVNKYYTPEQVKTKINRLNNRFNKSYNSVIMTCDKSDYRNAKETFKNMEDIFNKNKFLLVKHKGRVGTNRVNAMSLVILPSWNNVGNVNIGPRQLLGRFSRCRFNWNDFASAVKKVKCKKDRELLIEIATLQESKKVFSTKSRLVKSAWNEFVKPKPITKEQGIGFIKGLMENI